MLLFVRFAERATNRTRGGTGCFTTLRARVPTTLRSLLTADRLQLGGNSVQHGVGDHAQFGAGVLSLGAGILNEGGDIQRLANLYANGLAREQRNLTLLLDAAVLASLIHVTENLFISPQCATG